MKDLFRKYNIRAPRYTSYPALPYWNNQINGKNWVDCLKAGLKQESAVDLYIHIPYCEKLCWYCGCNRTISKNKDLARVYVDALINEFKLYQSLAGPFQIRSLHFGGGTPNFLPADSFRKLLGFLSKNFHREEFEGAVEVDPRTCSTEQLQVLASFGFKRISFGVQDFDLEVQKAINRVQPFELVQNVVEKARLAGFEHVNLDLIWGLPKQTLSSVAKTIKQVAQIGPDQISFYSYAHLPEKFAHQKLIRSEDILQGESKRALYELGKKELANYGLREIGMDHYAAKGGVILNAAKERRLTRNFMGYTDKKSKNLLGLGVSAISSNSFAFAQNEKGIPAYLKSLEEQKLPIVAGHLKAGEDHIREELIQNLMCNMQLPKEALAKISGETWVEGKIQEFLSDGLLKETRDSWLVTELGKKFIRSIALVFDEYFPAAAGEVRFSQSV